MFESSEEKSSKLSRSHCGKPNTGYVNNLYQAPTKNYNPKLERITEDISSISNSVDVILKTIGASKSPFHQQTHLPTSQYSRRSSAADDFESDLPHNTVPTMLFNTNSSDSSSINLNQPQRQQPVINGENGVILAVRRIDNNPFAEENDDDDDDVVVSKASL